ncbi:hypothetical protein Salat_2468500 [Sesamum alatum]|uniref:Transmembrane protein n=1 Tax=Sesamum alatum TaxID=300844 RepID=A0AAE1XQZ3_9LAMI|nr:hypothetical protein Salat_2468500 [Sesamum alatum]
MARPLPMQNPHSILPAPLTFLIVLTAVFSVFSAVTFLCGSRGEEKKTVRLGGKSNKLAVKKMDGSLSSKALLMARMICWRKVQDDGGAEDSDGGGDGEDGAVWKKRIMKGEKCRPLDFSGRILYDSDGNLLPE